MSSTEKEGKMPKEKIGEVSEETANELEMTDEELALLVQSGNSERFGMLMSRYDAKLTRYGRRFLSNPDNIEDLVQDVFIKVYKNIKGFDATQKFSPWIYRIAHNTFVNGLKKSLKDSLHFFDLDTLVSHPIYEDPSNAEREQKQMKIMIEKGLDQVSPQYREIMILYYIEGLGYKEISDVLRIPTGTVGIRLKRGKEALKKVYEKLGLKYEPSE